MLAHRTVSQQSPSSLYPYSIFGDSDSEVPLLIAHSSSNGTQTETETETPPVTPVRPITNTGRKPSRSGFIVSPGPYRTHVTVRNPSDDDIGYEAEAEECRSMYCDGGVGYPVKKMRRPELVRTESNLLTRRRHRAASLRSTPVSSPNPNQSEQVYDVVTIEATAPDSPAISARNARLELQELEESLPEQSARSSAIPPPSPYPTSSNSTLTKRSLQSLTPLTPLLPSTPRFSPLILPSRPHLQATSVVDNPSPLELPISAFDDLPNMSLLFAARSIRPALGRSTSSSRSLSLLSPVRPTHIPIPPNLLGSSALAAFGITCKVPDAPHPASAQRPVRLERASSSFRQYREDGVRPPPRGFALGPPSPTIGSTLFDKSRSHPHNPYFSAALL